MKMKRIYFILNLSLLFSTIKINLIYSASNSYNQIIKKIDGYFNDYNQEDNIEFIKFLKDDLSNYPKSDELRLSIANPDMQAAWMNGTGLWENKGFKNYVDGINSCFLKYSDNIDAIAEVCIFIKERISSMKNSEVKKIVDDYRFVEIQTRINEYIKAIDNSNIKIKQQIENNLDTTKTFLTGDSNGGYLDTYRRLNETLEEKILNFSTKILKINKKIEKIYSIARQ